MTASEVDLAWAAGLFEGEGFLVRRKVGNRVYLQVGIEMRDRDVMERFVAILIAGGVKRTARNCGPKEAACLPRLRPKCLHTSDPRPGVASRIGLTRP
jgi:hypothetical protein